MVQADVACAEVVVLFARNCESISTLSWTIGGNDLFVNSELGRQLVERVNYSIWRTLANSIPHYLVGLATGLETNEWVDGILDESKFALASVGSGCE